MQVEQIFWFLMKASLGNLNFEKHQRRFLGGWMPPKAAQVKAVD